MTEEYPLLFEETEEDKFVPTFQRRGRRLSALRGRAKTQMKGAAVIMKRWPEHWSSILNYWWIGFGMIAFTTFVIYNTLFTIGMVQQTNARTNKYAPYKYNIHKTEPPLPDIFMHFIVSNGEDDYNKYMPYINLFADKHKDFMYNIVIITNVTSEENTNNHLLDETNNNIALNSLWSSNINYDNLAPLKGNVNIKYTTLSNYLNYSPLKKHWKELPHHLIPFLVRAVSVWDKGGIAINPIILTPQSPHGAYMDKLATIMKNFKYNQKNSIPKQGTPPFRKRKVSPRVNNNILDIIYDTEHKNLADPYEEVLHAEESVNIMADTEIIPYKGHEATTEKQIKFNPKHIGNKLGGTENHNKEKDSLKMKDDTNEGHTKLLPLFLEYLFHNKNNNLKNTTHSIEKRSTRPALKNEDSKDVMTNFWNDIKSSDDYKPMIVSAKGMQNNSTPITATNSVQDDDKIFELTVDLKGNLIATGTPCHAFIGNIFVNALHHTEKDSLTDVIIKELSIFCKGLLSSCMGIDVMLV